MTWTYEPDALAAALTRAGFDVDTSQATLASGGSLTARRDRAAATWLVTIDAGGRLKATLTRTVEESAPDSLDVGGQTLRAITEVTRTVNVAGQLEDPNQLETILAELDKRLRASGEAKSAPEPKRRPWWRRWRSG